MKSREIKFRVWTGTKMEYNVMAGFLGAFYVQGMDEKDKACMSNFNTIYPDQTPVMQFTGLKDKNGKDIYEGDIVSMVEILFRGTEEERICFWTGQIYFHSGCFWFEGKGRSDNQWFHHNEEDLSVLGNIYENQTLLDVA